MTRWSQIRRGRPWRVLSEITCASEVAPRAAFVTLIGKWVWRFLCGPVTDGDVGLFRAENDLSEEVEFGAPVPASLDGLDPADVAFDSA